MPKNTKELKCFHCHQFVTVDRGVGAVLCANCTARVSDPPPAPTPTAKPLTAEEREAKKEAKAAKKLAKLEALKNKKKGKGRGWHLKQLFEFEGEFYSFGKKITDAEVAKIRKALKKAGK